MARFGVFFGGEVGRRAHEIAEVGEDIAGHDGVEVDHAEHVSVLVEEHVVHLRVAVAEPLGQFARLVQSFGEAHLVGMRLNLVEQRAHFGHTTALVGLYGFAQLLQAEAHVVEIGNRFAQRLGHVGQHGLETAERLSRETRAFGRHGLHRHRPWDEDGEPPILLPLVLGVGLAVLRAHEAEHLAVDVVLVLLHQLAADVVGHHLDVVLQEVYIGEDGVVDALQHVVGPLFGRRDLVSVVDKAVAQRLDLGNGTLHRERLEDGFDVCVIHA